MEYFWLAIIVLIILRAIGVQSGRYKSPGKVDLPREDLPHMGGDYPQSEGGFSYSEGDYPYSVRDSAYLEEDYLYSDDGRPAWETASAAEPGGHDSEWAGKAGQKGRLAAEPAVVSYAGGVGGKTAAISDEPAGSARGSGHQLLAGGLTQHEVIKGMVWHQILGPRGGLQASRRRRY